jgi:hypothetical protein
VDRNSLEHFALRVRGLAKTETLDAAAAEVLEAFDRAGVSCLLLKGVALSRLLYGDDRQRGYNDVDLLVAPDRLEDANRVLMALGYANTTAQRGVEDIGGAVHADTWVRRDQRIGPLMVDLHARLPGVQASADAAWAVLADRRDTIAVGGREAQVLGRDGLALHVATHAAQHGLWDPKPIADLTYALDHWPAHIWQDAARLAAELEAVDAFAVGLRLVGAGARLAEELELPRSERIEWEMENRAMRPRGTFHLAALMEARGRERLSVLRRVFFPKREWIVWEDPRAAHGGVRLMAARLRHLLRTPVWALRAVKYRRRARRAGR